MGVRLFWERPMSKMDDNSGDGDQPTNPTQFGPKQNSIRRSRKNPTPELFSAPVVQSRQDAKDSEGAGFSEVRSHFQSPEAPPQREAK